MQYLLMLYVDEIGWPKMTPAEQEQGAAAYAAYTEALKKAGVYVGANRLRPTATATTVRWRTASRRCWTGPTPSPRNSSAATT